MEAKRDTDRYLPHDKRQLPIEIQCLRLRLTTKDIFILATGDNEHYLFLIVVRSGAEDALQRLIVIDDGLAHLRFVPDSVAICNDEASLFESCMQIGK